MGRRSEPPLPLLLRTVLVVAAAAAAMAALMPVAGLAASPSPSSPSPTPTVSPQPAASPPAGPQIQAGPQPLSREAPWLFAGSGFPPDTSVTVLWDSVDLHQPITTDGSGAFSWTMGVPQGTSNDPHQLCALAGQVRACITVIVEQVGGASPSPPPAPTVRAGPQPLARDRPFDLSGSGFPPITAVTVLWDGANLKQPITTDGSGDFSLTMGVPPGTSNDPHQLCVLAGPVRACITVTVEQTGGPSQSPSIPLTPTLETSSQPLPRGAPFTLNGSGFPPNAAVTVLWDGTDLQQSITTDDAGNFGWTMAVPAYASNDPHRLCVGAGQVMTCITVTVMPAPSAGGTTSPSPTAAPTHPATPVSLSPVAAVARPPWVFVPIAVLLVAAGFASWLVWRRVMRY